MRESPGIDEYLSWHAADLADHLQRLSQEEAHVLLLQLPPNQTASVLAEMEPEIASEHLAGIPVDQVADLLQRIPPQDAVDLLQELPPALRRDVLAALPDSPDTGIRALLRYSVDTAGGIMSNRYIALGVDMTIGGALEWLRARALEDRAQDISYLYVIDKEGKLAGIVGLRDLVFSPGDQPIKAIMNREVRFVRVDTDQEELARQFEHYHFLGLPVVDADGRLIGVVKANDALEIARKEATEDMQLMVGLSGEERALAPWQKSVSRRLPWLSVNLATASAAAMIVSFFENIIAQWTALAVFLPIISALGGNAGMQTLTIVVRDLALGEISLGEGRKALRKEMILGGINGLAIGIVVGILGYLWKGSVILGGVACLAMWFTLLAATFSGVVIPLGLKLCRVDPAHASSIFLTTVTDMAGFFFFLGLASMALQFGAP